MTGAFATPEGYYPLSETPSNGQIETALLSGYEIIHAIQGRVRLRVLRLASDSAYADRLNQWLTALSGVTQVNVNTLTKSITICYQQNTPAAGFVQGLLSPVQRVSEDGTATTAAEFELPEPLRALTQAATDLKPWFYRLAVTLLQVTGVAFLVIGVVGVILPILPGTPFLILASFCFLAASELSSNY